MSHEELPIMCDLTVFSTDTRAEIAATVPEIFNKTQKVQELPDGYVFQFPNEPGMFMQLAHFVEHERQCCPFYTFSLEAEPSGGSFSLRMTGGDGVKEFMQTAWQDLQGAVSQGLIQTGPSNDLDEAIARSAPVLANEMEKAMPLSNAS